MIKLLRLDHRLLHGQVAYSWCQNIGADCILIASDDVAGDELRKVAYTLAKPCGVKLVIKTVADSVVAINSGVTDKYKLLILVDSVEALSQLALNCKQVECVNLGGLRQRENTRSLSGTVYVTHEEQNLLREILQANIRVLIKQVPMDHEIVVTEKLLDSE